MGRILYALVLLVFVAGCGGRSGNMSAPRNLDDACAIVKQRPGYLPAMKRTERRWGVPVHVQMATIYQESKFVGNARTPLRSSAYGYSQVLDATWEEYRKDTGKRRARRDDIRDATDFMGWYMTGTRERTGIPLTDARNQYLAYHEGRTGYLRGNYNSKPWLLRVADSVQERSQVYRAQLGRCRR